MAHELPQTYLITPSDFDHTVFCDDLRILITIPWHAYVWHWPPAMKLILKGDALREVCHARDVAIVIDSHVLMVERLGLMGFIYPMCA